MTSRGRGAGARRPEACGICKGASPKVLRRALVGRNRGKKGKEKLAEFRVLFRDPETPRKLARPRKTGKMTVEEWKGQSGKPGLFRLASCSSPAVSQNRRTVFRGACFGGDREVMNAQDALFGVESDILPAAADTARERRKRCRPEGLRGFRSFALARALFLLRQGRRVVAPGTRSYQSRFSVFFFPSFFRLFSSPLFPLLLRGSGKGRAF